jgi:hypothetical protein
MVVVVVGGRRSKQEVGVLVVRGMVQAHLLLWKCASVMNASRP